MANTLARLGLGFDSLRRTPIHFADGQAEALAELRAAVAGRAPSAAAGNMFNEDLLQAYLAHAPDGNATEIAKGVPGAVRSHAGEHPQSDDSTIVTLCRMK